MPPYKEARTFWMPPYKEARTFWMRPYKEARTFWMPPYKEARTFWMPPYKEARTFWMPPNKEARTFWMPSHPTKRPGRSRCKPKKKAKAGQRWAVSPDSSSDVKAWTYLVCGEPYGNSGSGESWIQCQPCHLSSHHDCTAGRGILYLS